MAPHERIHIKPRFVFFAVVALDDQNRVFEWNGVGKCFGIGENVAALNITEESPIQLFGRDVGLAISKRWSNETVQNN